MVIYDCLTVCQPAALNGLPPHQFPLHLAGLQLCKNFYLHLKRKKLHMSESPDVNQTAAIQYGCEFGRYGALIELAIFEFFDGQEIQSLGC